MNLPKHDASTVAYMGWSGLKNGNLLSVAEEAGFDVLLTGDKNLSYQQNLTGRRIAIVVLSTQDWPVLKNKLDEISDALAVAIAGSFFFVDCG